MRWFKKAVPNQKVYLSTGAQLNFERVDDTVGIYPPEGTGISEWLASELVACAQGGRGGVEEISQQEYQELIVKKNSVPWKPSWREEVSKAGMLKAAQDRSNNTPGAVALADIKEDSPGVPLPKGAVLGTGRPGASKPPPPPQE